MAVDSLWAQVDIGLGAAVADTGPFTLGMEFHVTANCSLTGIWFWSPTSEDALPDACGVYQITGTGTGTLVASNTTPTWSGGVAAGAWVKCTFDGSVTLTTGNNYKVCVHASNTTGHLYGAISHYWDSGTGASGITSGGGLIVAPNASGGDGGQDTFFTGGTALTYPTSTFNSPNYGIDVEVTSGGTDATVTFPQSILVHPT